MEIRDLESVLAIVRAGTVPAAARMLGVAHTTLYRRVEALEEQLGVRLFVRAADGWRATDEGAEIAREAEDIEVRLRDVEARVGGRDGLHEGDVRVATGEHSFVMLTPALARFSAKYPGIRVSVMVVSKAPRVAAGEADIVLWATTEPEPEAIGRRIMTVRLAIYAHPDVASLPPERRPWVALDPVVDPGQQVRWEREHVPTHLVRLRTTSRALHLEAIRAGIGAGVLPNTVGAPTGLVRTSPWMPELERPLWILTRRDTLAVARVNALHGFLREEARRAEATA